MRYATTISPWGNSEAIRIPKSILRSAGLRAGDKVNVSTDHVGRIAITPIRQEHRHVKPQSGITFDSLVADYEPAQLPTRQWPDEDMRGTEFDVWTRA